MDRESQGSSLAFRHLAGQQLSSGQSTQRSSEEYPESQATSKYAFENFARPFASQRSDQSSVVPGSSRTRDKACTGSRQPADSPAIGSEQYPESEGTSKHGFGRFAATQNDLNWESLSENLVGASSGQGSGTHPGSPVTSHRASAHFSQARVAASQDTSDTESSDSEKTENEADDSDDGKCGLEQDDDCYGGRLQPGGSRETESDRRISRPKKSFGAQVSFADSTSRTESIGSVTEKVEIGLHISITSDESSSRTCNEDQASGNRISQLSLTEDSSRSEDVKGNTSSQSQAAKSSTQQTQNTLDHLVGPSCKRNIFGNLLYLTDDESSTNSGDRQERPKASSSSENSGFGNSVLASRKKVLDRSSDRNVVIPTSSSEEGKVSEVEEISFFLPT